MVNRISEPALRERQVLRGMAIEKSHRENVKKVVREWLDPEGEGDAELMMAESATLADLVFEVIGINKDEQDNIGGMFVHVKERP